LTSYGTYPLLWLSCNAPDVYGIYRRFFDGLQIETPLKELVDHASSIVMYCGFFVIGDRAPGHLWHTDYFPGANAYTLITPLSDLERDHGNLLYKDRIDQVATYRYRLGEAIVLGEQFLHTTEPYNPCERARILVSMTFGTDKLEHWEALKRTVGVQSNYLMLPCGHVSGTCRCLAAAAPSQPRIVSGVTRASVRKQPKVGRNQPCPCRSGKKYKHCHG